MGFERPVEWTLWLAAWRLAQGLRPLLRLRLRLLWSPLPLLNLYRLWAL
jgi:hypothetical protein